MICPKCDAKLPDGMRFCFNCGAVFSFPGESQDEAVELVKRQYHLYQQMINVKPQEHESETETALEGEPASATDIDAAPTLERKPETKAGQQTAETDQQTSDPVSLAQAPLQPAPEPDAVQQPQPSSQPEPSPQPQPYPQPDPSPQPLPSSQPVPSPQPQPQAVQQQPLNAATGYPAQGEKPKGQGTSGLAITALVLGIVAISTSFLPIINNASFFIALVGIVFAIAGIACTGKRKGKRGRGIAVASLFLSIIAIAAVLATQSLFVSVLNSFRDGAKPVTTTSQPAESGNSAQTDYSSLSLGQPATLDNGVTVTVTGIRTGLKNYDGTPVTEITVSYSNAGQSNEQFNLFDWKAEDANGVINNATYFLDGENELSSGQLAPGGSVTGNVYFEGDAVKVHYYSNVFVQSESSICWTVQ